MVSSTDRNLDAELPQRLRIRVFPLLIQHYSHQDQHFSEQNYAE